MNTAYTRSELPGMTPRRGKVRDVYDFGDRLLVVATDRISAFDWVLPTGIPDKGRVLTKISEGPGHCGQCFRPRAAPTAP